MSRDTENNQAGESATTTDARAYGNTQSDHTDKQRFPTVPAKKFNLVGMLAVVTLVIALAVVGYRVFYTEQKRMDATPVPATAQPLTPESPTLSTQPGAAVSPQQPADSAPANP